MSARAKMAGSAVRWALEGPLAAILLFVGLAKILMPDPNALFAVAARTRISPALVRAVHDVMAILEVALGLALLTGLCTLIALKVSLLMSLGAGVFWVFSDLGRHACGCVGRINLSPAVRLVLILVLVALSVLALWRRLPSAAGSQR